MVAVYNFETGKAMGLPDCMEFDQSRCAPLAFRLMDLFYNLNLKDKVPEVVHSVPFIRKPNLHKMFILIGCAQDSRRQSETVYDGARRFLVEQEDNLWDLTMPGDTRIDKLGEEYFGGPIGRTSGDILRSTLNFIHEKHGGSLDNLTQDGEPIDDVRKRLMGANGGIYGVGPGIASLIVKNLVRFNYYRPSDYYDLPIKIDRHAMRLSLSHGVIRFTKPTPPGGIHTEALEQLLEDAYRDVCRKERYDPIDFCDAKWAIGSQHCTGKYTQCARTCDLRCDQDYSIKDERYLVYPAKYAALPLFQAEIGNANL